MSSETKISQAKPMTNGNKSSQRREEILQAAFQVMSTAGLSNTTVRAVAQQAGCSVGTVLYHFDGGIEQLQKLTLSTVMEELYESRLQIVASDQSASQKLARMVQVGVPDTISENLAAIYASIPAVRQDPVLAEQHRNVVEKQVSLYRSVITTGTETELTLPQDADADDVARNIVALEDAYDLYPQIGLEVGGGPERRRRVRHYIQLALSVQLPPEG